MSLLTVERSSPSPQESVAGETEDVLSCSSYEGFVAREHYAMCLSPRPWASLGRHGEQLRIFSHLKKLVKLMRPSDTLRLAVELENSMPRAVTKYVVIITTSGYQGTEETVVLGTEQEGSTIRLCLVLPLWRDTEIKLDGDGGFSVHTGDRHQIFKPSSVQSMWTALQMLYKATEHARMHNYFVGGLSHTWILYYQSRLTDEWSILNEWNIMEDVESFRPDSPIYSGATSDTIVNEDRRAFEKLLVHKLREHMLHADLEEVTSRQLRLQLEEEMKLELKEYRGFLDQQMLRILGQMERPSEIYPYLYLGSEWNASNLVELQELGVGYIINITREIDNFYPEVFKYLNIRLYDMPESELMKHWDKTYQFIKEARTRGSKVLVHCKMGISRSAATVIAYVMKEYRQSLEEAMAMVKVKRNCINPNDGFIHQLRAYEGILKARHNELWGRQAPSRLQPFHKMRSQSDPNLLQAVQREASYYNAPGAFHESEEEPELSFLAEDSNYRQYHVATSPLRRKQLEPCKSATTPLYFSSLPFRNSTPINKDESIRHYLASLPCSSEPRLHQLEEDQGIGENMACVSESGSDYSSPILTPPEEEQIHALYRLAKEVQENHRQRLTSDDFDSKESVSNQPTEDRSTVNSELPPTEPSLPSTSEVPGSLSEAVKFKVPCPPFSSITTTATSLARDQPVAGSDYLSSLQVPPKELRTSSLPHGLTYGTYPTNNKKTNISPNSSKTTLSSLGNPSALAGPPPPQEAVDSRTSSRADSRSPVPREPCLPVLTENEVVRNDLDSFESKSDSPLELRETAVGQHRRAKSDTCNLSGPVKTAQIQSVPERVKEIEELHAHKASKPLQVQSTTTLEREKENPVDFYIGGSSMSPSVSPSPSPSPRPSPGPVDKRSSMSSSISRSSSEESLPMRQSLEASHDEEFQEQPRSPGKLYGSHVTATRHSSLSPKPSVVDTQMRLQSSMSLPPEIDPLLCSQEAMSEESIANSLQGVVRAKVQSIEERSKEGGHDSRKVSVTSSECSLKRSSPPAQRKPSDAIVAQRPSSVAESVDSSKATEGTFSFEGSEFSQALSECSPPPPPPPPLPPREILRRRPSSGVVMERPSSVMESSAMSLSLQPVSSRSMSVQNIPSQVASVRQLKRKFEDSTEGSENCKPQRNFTVNLRRAHSLRDMESPYRQRTRRKMASGSRISGDSRVESARGSPPRSEYITTIPTVTVRKDVDDFETTLNKFSLMTNNNTAAQ